MDEEMLRELLVMLDDGEYVMELNDFTEEEFEKFMEQQQRPAKVLLDIFAAEEETAKIKNPATRQGYIWQLGRHRLKCGDANNLMGVLMPICVYRLSPKFRCGANLLIHPPSPQRFDHLYHLLQGFLL